jgi:DHA2 family multidrug resistance protein
VECLVENPIIHLRVFRSLSFCSGNLINFFTFFSLFGTIVLLPIYVQELMGYTSFLAGLVLGPGGIASMIAMPIAGRLVTKINPKGILAFGIAVAAYSCYLMSQFNLLADFQAIVWPRFVFGIGMGLLFIPLNTLTMSAIRKEEMGNAASVFNLLRNLGGSFGVAFVTTLLARRAQFHQSHLVEHLTPFDRNLQITLPQLSQMLHERGFTDSFPNQGGLGIINGQLFRQASMLAVNDIFHLLSLMMVVVLVLVPVIKRVKDSATVSGLH